MSRHRIHPGVAGVLAGVWLALGAASGGFAQQPHRAMPLLRAQTESGATSLELVDLDIRVTLEGHLARTEYTLTYRNPLDRDLRADFLFPLPADAHVSDVGLFFDGILRRGVAVARGQARTAYARVVQRRVDPILAEWSAGNAFRYDVYPIPAKREKKIYLAYDQQLPDGGDGWRYDLDLRYGVAFRNARLEIVSGWPIAPTSAGPRAIALFRQKDRWVFSKQNETLDARLAVTIPRPRRTEALLELGSDGVNYLSLPVDTDRLKREPYPAASHVTLYWDASASAAGQRRATLLAFLRAFVARQARPVDVAVVPFHLWLEQPILCPRAETDAGWQALETALSRIVPAGASQQAAVFDALAAGPIPAGSRVLIVTDGLTSIGRREDVTAAIRRLSELRRPIAIINTAEYFDDDLLASVAAATKGWYFDLRALDPQGIERRVDEAMRTPLMVKRAYCKQAMEAGAGGTVALRSGEPLTLAARFERPVAVAEVTLDLEDARGTRSETVRYATRRATERVDLLRSAWARARLSALLAAGDRAAVLDLGRQQRLATPETSLVVLENWWDYLAHDVPMPPDVRTAYREARRRESRDWQEFRRLWGATLVREGTNAFDAGGFWTVTGVVVDGSGALVPGTEVELTSPQGNARAVTDSRGRFVLRTFAPTSFELHARLQGFATTTVVCFGGLNDGSDLRLTLRITGIEETASFSVAREEKLVIPESKLSADAGGAMMSLPGPASPVGSGFSRIAGQDSSVGSGFSRIADWLRTQDIDRERLRAVTADQQRETLGAALKSLAQGAENDAEILARYGALRSALGSRTKWLPIDASQALAATRPALALRVLSDLLEDNADDAGLQRVVGQVLEARGRPDLAQAAYRRSIEMAPHESDGYVHVARANYIGPPDGLWPWIARASLPVPSQEIQRSTAPELAWLRPWDRLFYESMALQVELMWDRRAVDLDLEIVEPSGMTASRKNDVPALDGLSRNAAGYGPEVYILERPHLGEFGEYRLRARYANVDRMESDLTTVAVVVIYRQDAAGKVERLAYPIMLSKVREAWETTVTVQ